MCVTQGLTVGPRDTLRKSGSHSPLRLPPVQRLPGNPNFSNEEPNAFAGEHAIDQLLTKSSRILTKHDNRHPFNQPYLT